MANTEWNNPQCSLHKRCQLCHRQHLNCNECEEHNNLEPQKPSLPRLRLQEWIRIDNDIATIGITDFAQGELGDIVYVEIETLNQTLNAETVFGSVEAVKTVSDLFMPLSGEIIEINEALDDTPESVNDDPYGDGWMVRVKCSDLSQIEGLLDAKAYKSIIAGG